MADSEAIKILGNLWADSGDRTDPDDPTLTPAIIRTVGYPPTFSAADGDTPRRRPVNQRFRELDGAAANGMIFGIEPYDARIDYVATPAPSIVQVAGALYRANTANGPTPGNVTGPTDTGQTVWDPVAGETSLPAAPSAPVATAPASGTLVFTWNCPLDGGNEVTAFDFQWRVSGAAWPASSQTVAVPRVVVSSLTNGQTIQARVLARSAQGDSAWSAAGSGVPAGTIPGGGVTLALRAFGGDGEVDTDWLEPDNGGEAITGYTLQWRSGPQSFSAGRQVSSTDITETVTLANDTEWFFRVRATNSVGDGTWSNETSATPVAAVVIPPPPPDTVPGAPGTPAGTVLGGYILWQFDPPSDDGGAQVTEYDFQLREQGAAWSGNVHTVESGAYLQTGAAAGTTYQARARARNSVGAGGWSGTGSANAGPTRFSRTADGNENFTWPWDTQDGYAILTGAAGGSGSIAPARNTGADIGVTGTPSSLAAYGDHIWAATITTVSAYTLAGIRADTLDIDVGSVLGMFIKGGILHLLGAWRTHAYDPADASRQAGEDIFFTNPGNSQQATGCAYDSDRDIIWIHERRSDSIYAFPGDGGAKNPAHEIAAGLDLDNNSDHAVAYANGIVWISNENFMLPFDAATGAMRVEYTVFLPTQTGQQSIASATVSGSVMYAADTTGIYAYDLPADGGNGGNSIVTARAVTYTGNGGDANSQGHITVQTLNGLDVGDIINVTVGAGGAAGTGGAAGDAGRVDIYPAFA